QSFAATSATWLGWMPMVANRGAYWAASSTEMRLVAAVVATTTTRETPAATARSTTSARSASKRSSSRWAWVSMSSGGTSMRRGRGGGRERLQGPQVATLQLDKPIQHCLRFGVAQHRAVALQGIYRPAPVLDQAWQQVVDRDKVHCGERHRERA